MRKRVQQLYSLALALLLVGGLSACGDAESEPVPDERVPSAQQVGDDGCQVFSQTINIDQQSDLAEFADLECFDIDGHLFVQETGDIEDLDELDGLRSVTGYVGIADNQALTDVSLDNLESTGEGLVVEGNEALVNIEFGALRDVSHYLHVFGNPALESARFPRLFNVGDDVIFAGVDALTNLELPRLSTVMGTFIFEHSDGLECLCLPNLVVVHGDFLVHFNGGLRSLAAPVLTTVSGDVEIRRNPQLEHVDLDCLDRVGGAVTVLHNQQLAQCHVDEWVNTVSTIGGDVATGDNAQTCPEQPVNAEDVGCASCTTGICVDRDIDEPGDDDDDDLPGDDDDDDDLPGDDDDDDLPGDDDDDDLPGDDDDDDLPGDDDDDDLPGDDDDDVPGDDDDDDDDDDDVTGDVSIESLSLEDNPNSELSAFLNVQTSGPAFVRVSADSGDHQFEIDFDDQARTDHRLTLIGFRPDRTYQLDVTAYTDDGAGPSEQITFTSGPLPADFAPLDATVSNPSQMADGITLFNMTRWTPVIDNSWAYIVGVDESGEVVWYYEPPNRAQDTILLQNGNIAFNTSQSEIIEINLAGEIVNRWSASDLGVDYFHHEVHELPNGNLTTLASELQYIQGFGPDGNLTQSLVGDVVVEFTRDGQVVNQHSMFDILDEHRYGVGGFHGGYWNARYANEAPEGTKDWTHGNAIFYDASDDTFLVSLRHQDWVIKIDRQTGDLIWRLGAEGDFELTNGEWFYHQHNPILVNNGNILLYDNGNLRPGVQRGNFYSRAVEFDIDAAGADPNSGSQGQATQVWEFVENQSFYSDFVSGVDKLDNGNVLIADGARMIDQTLSADDPNNLLFFRIVEVTDDANPQKVFELMVRDDTGQYGYTMYRASRVDLLGNAPSE